MNTPDLFDLGAASIETQGMPGNQIELGISGKPIGISDED
jgi:hypothetical protein